MSKPVGNCKVAHNATVVLFGMCLLALTLVSCQREEPKPAAEDDGRIVMSMSGMTRAVYDNIQIYMFNGENNANRGIFRRKLLQIERNGNILTANNVPAGTWDLTLVTAQGDAEMNRLTDPLVGRFRKNEVMLELTPQGGVLPQAPEIMTGRVAGQLIQPNQTNSGPDTDLSRNVAMVRVVIKDPKGYSTTGPHKLTLGNIPTRLNWQGELMPDKTTPVTSGSGVGMTGEFTITDTGGGAQECDTLNFIVPAHKGSDFMLASPADTTTCKLDISVDLKTPTGNYVKGPVEIPITPKANKILVVTLIPTDAKLDVRFAVTPWNYKQNNIIFE